MEEYKAKPALHCLSFFADIFLGLPETFDNLWMKIHQKKVLWMQLRQIKASGFSFWLHGCDSFVVVAFLF